MRVGMYKTSGGKGIVLAKGYSPESMAKILCVLEILQAEGLERLCVRTIEKCTNPKMLEIKKDNVRLFFFVYQESLLITHIVENKQKNKTEKHDKKLAVKRMEKMIAMPDTHIAWL